MGKLRARDPRLRDRAWMARTLAQHGEMWIALEVGVSRTTVRRRLALLGIASQPPGRRRGVTESVTATTPAATELDATEQAFRDRYRTAKARRAPATETTLAAAIRAAHHARQADDANAYDAALIDIAASAAVIHDHRQTLRRAA